jgi:hypothetical protein
MNCRLKALWVGDLCVTSEKAMVIGGNVCDNKKRFD